MLDYVSKYFAIRYFNMITNNMTGLKNIKMPSLIIMDQ